MLVLLAGASGAGKDTIKNAITNRMDNVISIPSYTTRKIREGEIPGVTYNYVSVEEFKRMIDNNELYEYNYHHDNYYGTSRKILNEKISLGYTIIKDIDVNGVDNLKKILQQEMKVISIFIRVPKDILIDRLKHRGDNLSEEELNLRISRMEYEESKMSSYDYVIDNIDLEETIQKVEEIIKSNKEQ